MEYNTTEEKLLLPEYGRNIQKMAKHLLTIQDKERRNIAAQELINVMGNLFPMPNLKDVRDFKHKLWDQLAAMTEYKLDVDYPFPIQHPEQMPKPVRPAYNNNRIAYRHYGLFIEQLIKKAILLEDAEEKKWLAQLIANHMKKQYIAWNKNTVNDDIIYKDLIEMSQGKLEVDTTQRIYVSPNQIPHAQPLNTNKGRRPDNGKKNFINKNRKK